MIDEQNFIDKSIKNEKITVMSIAKNRVNIKRELRSLNIDFNKKDTTELLELKLKNKVE